MITYRNIFLRVCIINLDYSIFWPRLERNDVVWVDGGECTKIDETITSDLRIYIRHLGF